MPIVKMPNGDLVRFPDDMPDSEIGGFIQTKFPDAFGQPEATPGRTFGGTLQDIGVTALKSAVGLPQSLTGFVDIPTGGRFGKALENVGVRFEDTQQALDEMYSPAQQAANERVRSAEGFVDTATAALQNPSVIATTVGESAGQMLGGAGIARGILGVSSKVAPLVAGAVGEGAIGAGAAAESIREGSYDGLLTGKQALASLGSGVGTAAFGALGGKLAQKLGLADVDTMLAQGGANAVAAGAAKQGFLKQVVGSGISEGVFEELPQSIQEQMWQNYATDKPITEGVGNAAALGLLAGGVMGGAGGGFNAVVARKVDRSPEQIAAEVTSQTTLDDAINAADAIIGEELIDEVPATPQRDFGAMSQGETGFGAVAELGDFAAQERIDLETRRAALAEQQAQANAQRLESELETTDSRVAGAQAQQERAKRLDLLDSIYANEQERTPGMTFLAALEQQFPNNPLPTPEEKAIIAQRENAYQAFKAMPNDNGVTTADLGVPEKAAKTEQERTLAQKIAQVDEYLASGFTPAAGGKKLVNGKGKTLFLNVAQREYLKSLPQATNGMAATSPEVGQPAAPIQPAGEANGTDIPAAIASQAPDMRDAVPPGSEIRTPAGTGGAVATDAVRPAAVDDKLAAGSAQRAGDAAGADARVSDGAGGAAVAQSKQKTIWQQTRAEYVAKQLANVAPEDRDIAVSLAERQHRNSVAFAMRSNKPVAANVLADYPDIVNAQVETESKPASPVPDDAAPADAVSVGEAVLPEVKPTEQELSSAQERNVKQEDDKRKAADLDTQDKNAKQTRTASFPSGAQVISDFKSDAEIKAHPSYKAAKAGDIQSAVALVADLVSDDSIAAAKAEFGEDVAYLPVMALEASGKNQIPNALAAHYAEQTGGMLATGIFQTNKAFHTGADAMERMIARSEFGGKVMPGQKYVLVDDVSTMGGTLADMASYIQSQGGVVSGAVLLTNSSRSGSIAPDAKVIRSLGERHGQAIAELFGIEPSALTRDESKYLIGFRTTDELRNRAASASAERSRRILSKVQPESSGVGELAQPEKSPSSGAKQSAIAAVKADTDLSNSDKLNTIRALNSGDLAPEDVLDVVGKTAPANSDAGGVRFSKQAPTETIYHGTTAEIAKQIEANGFDVSKSADGTIWFTSNKDIGEVAATGKGGIVERVIDASKMKIGGWEESDKYSVQELINMGYDGLRLPDDGEITYQIFNPEKLSKAESKFSKSESQIANPHTTESAKEAILSAHTGKIKGAIKAMFDAGKARSITARQAAAILGLDALFAKSDKVDNQSVLRSNGSLTVAFFYPKDGVTYFIADHLSKDASAKGLRGLAAHEIGVHALHLGRDSKEFQSILNQVDLMRRAGNVNATKAYNRAVVAGVGSKKNSETDAEYNSRKEKYIESYKEIIMHEQVAYLVQSNPDLPIVKRLIAWFRNAIREIGKRLPALQRAKFFEWSNSLTESDIVFMAQDAMARWTPDEQTQATGEMAMQFSKELNQQLSVEQGEEWRNAYVLDDTWRDNQVLRETASVFNEVFGTEIIGIKPTEERFNVIGAMRHNGKIYINVDSKEHGFVQLAGHELLHDIRQKSPKMYDYLADKTRGFIISGGLPKYRDYLRQAELNNPELDSEDFLHEELLADAVGDALASPEFLKSLAESNPSRFKILMRTIQNWLRDVMNKMTNGGFGSSEYFTDIGELHNYIAGVLSAYSQTNKAESIDGVQTIKYSAKPAQTDGNRASWDAPEPSRFDDLVYSLQDKNIDMKRVVEAVKASGAELAEKFNPYLQEELFHGRSAKRTQDFVNTELKPLLTEMKARGLTMAELDEYLHARHAKEANALIAERDPDMADGGSGMTNQQADDYMAGLAADKKARLDAAAKKVDAIIARTRELYVSYGLVSRDQADSWAQMFDHYVPLMRDDHDGGMGIGQGFSIKGKEVKHRTGSTAAVVDIFANIAMQREKAIVRGEKNRVAVALAGLAKLNPNPDFWTFDKLPVERVLNDATGLVEERINPTFRSRDNVVIAKIKDASGQVHERAVVFNERNERAMRMAQALKNLDATQLGGILGVSAKITRYFASINTQYNPVFGVVNLIRDSQAVLLNLSSTALADHKAEVLKHIPSALKGIYADVRAERKGGPATSKWAKLWEEMQDEGGMTGYRDLYRNSADRAAAIENELDPYNWANSEWGKVFTANGTLKVPLTKAQDMAAPIFDWLSDYNLTMEGATRLSAYKVAIDNGMSKQQAASIAKNITVNFNRKGRSGQQAGALYAFFNAAMQGTARIGQTVFDMDGGDIKTLRLSKAGKTIVYGGILLGSMQALALAAAGFGDDEPPEFLRERSLILPIGGKKYLTLPMPLGFHAIPNIGRIATEFLLGGFEKPAEHVVKLIGVFSEAFNPIGSAGVSMQTIAPTALDPFAALAENKDWTGKSIYKEDYNALKPTPGFTRNKDTASAWAKFLAEGINWATGGTDYTPGAFSPTADQIDYLAGQVTGGVGRELTKVSQTAGSLATGEELPTYKVPLFGRFYGDSASQSSQGNAYYANLLRINEVKAEIEGRREDGLPVDEYKAEHPEWRLIGRAKFADNMISKLRKRKRELLERDAPREQIRAIEEMITKEMKRLNDAVVELEEREAA